MNTITVKLAVTVELDRDQWAADNGIGSSAAEVVRSVRDTFREHVDNSVIFETAATVTVR